MAAISDPVLSPAKRPQTRYSLLLEEVLGFDELLLSVELAAGLSPEGLSPPLLPSPSAEAFIEPDFDFDA